MHRAGVAADRLVKMPDGIDFKTAAAMMLQGMTAQYLVSRTYPVKSGDTIVVHAAAGGVGLILCQWAKHLGATVIGVVSTEQKAELARAHGAAHTVGPRQSGGRGEADHRRGHGAGGVRQRRQGHLERQPRLPGAARADGELRQCLGSGAAVDIGMLAAKGSLYVTRPTLATYTAKRADLEKVAADLFDVVGKGAVKIEVNQTFPLKDAAAAHIALESRKTTGSTVLLP